MKKEEKKQDFPSELRYDLVSKDWVVIATGRARRPETFKKDKKINGEDLNIFCPFCNLNKKDKPLLYIPSKENWQVVVIPNKYPAFVASKKINKKREGGLYQLMSAWGFHEVVVTKDHKKSIALFSYQEMKNVLDVYQLRYLTLKKHRLVKYISIFHNHGKEAGASINHPHSQIIAIPLIDTDLKNSLNNSKHHFETKGKCIYCEMNRWEMKVRKRIVFENNSFLAVCPFASKSAFEIVISPKKHLSYFEEITDQEKWDLAEIFVVCLNKIYKGLSNPDYNFYLHTSPCDKNENHSYYHWHWTILPKTSVWAGFEIGTRMEISTIQPEKAAEYLRKQ
jgi:UDPglucose--hexose-1-phosphate uridylyltransferase